MADKEVEQVWNDFWKPIVTKEGYGVSLEQVKKELFDYHQILDGLPRVFGEVTGGRCSKPNTDPDIVISLHEDHVNELIDEHVKEAIEDYELDNARRPKYDDFDDDIPF